MRNTFVPHRGHVPESALRPFLPNLTSLGSLMSTAFLSLTQYAWPAFIANITSLTSIKRAEPNQFHPFMTRN